MAGNLQTIELMKRIARKASEHPKVRFTAIEILNEYGVLPNDYRDEALAIGQWVKKNVRYVRDANFVEQLNHPLLMLDLISQGRARGDCDDMSLLIATLLLSIGHSPAFRAVRYQGNHGPFHHIYVVDDEKNFGERNESRVVLDAIIRDQPIGTEVPHTSGQDYPV